MTLDEIQEGMPVLYVPRQAQGERTHPDCQRGIVTGKTTTQVFVRYGTDRHSHATVPEMLARDDAGVPFSWRYPSPPPRGRKEG